MNTTNGCSYDSSCYGNCILSKCGAGCAKNDAGGCGGYNACSVGCYKECATSSCTIVCYGLATVKKIVLPIKGVLIILFSFFRFSPHPECYF